MTEEQFFEVFNGLDIPNKEEIKKQFSESRFIIESQTFPSKEAMTETHQKFNQLKEISQQVRMRREDG